MIKIAGGKKEIIVFSPIMHSFDGAEDLFKTIFQDLLTDYTFVIYDSLMYADFNNKVNFYEYSNKFIDIINKHKTNIFMGFSFGGSILCNIIQYLPKNAKLFLISTPSVISYDLKSKLKVLIDLLSNKNDKIAKIVLEYFVFNRTTETNISNYKDYTELERNRLLFGFSILLNHHFDKNNNHKIYNIYGANSNLVTKKDICIANNFEIKNSGMRVFEDNNLDTIKIIKEFCL